MSPSRKKSVPQLVRKYTAKYPELNRPILRKLIRLENPELFSRENLNSSSNLKNLDRHLGKAFKKDQLKTVGKPEPLEEQKAEKASQQDASPAMRYFQWRGTPEGGGNRFWAALFPAPQKPKKGKPVKDKPIYVPQVKPRRLSDHIPNPDEIDKANQSEKER